MNKMSATLSVRFLTKITTENSQDIDKFIDRIKNQTTVCLLDKSKYSLFFLYFLFY
jgi:hypothetical protein